MSESKSIWKIGTSGSHGISIEKNGKHIGSVNNGFTIDSNWSGDHIDNPKNKKQKDIAEFIVKACNIYQELPEKG